MFKKLSMAITLLVQSCVLLYGTSGTGSPQRQEPCLKECSTPNTWTASTKSEALLVASALGDALGRITEFDTTQQKLKGRYPNPEAISIAKSLERNGSTQLMYTDDTVLALDIAKAVAEAKKNSWNDEQLLSQIARNFIHDIDPANDPLYAERAHGATAPIAVSKLRKVVQTATGWWKEGGYALGLGSGSIMRVAPIVFAAPDDLKRVQLLADQQSIITHGHPAARAACVAFATGIFYALKNAEPQKIADEMLKAAETFDAETRAVNSKIPKTPFQVANDKESIEQLITRFRTALIKDTLTTADMIRYVIALWKRSPAFSDRSTQPQTVLGDGEDGSPWWQRLIGKGQAGGRSETGGLLAWNGDEAVAAALYIFLRHSTTGDTWMALQEAVWTVGDSDTIATLVGALMGARYGFTLTGEDARLLAKLENFEMIKKIAAELEPQ